jgi:hypothetical protein
MFYNELSEMERKAILREEVRKADPDLVLRLWRVLGLPERDVVEELVDETLGEATEDRQEPGGDREPIDGDG